MSRFRAFIFSKALFHERFVFKKAQKRRVNQAALFGTSVQLNSMVKQVKNGIEISLDDSNETRFVDYLWLFDNCRCPKCYMHNVNQKLVDPRTITADIQPKTIQHKGDDDLNLAWSDDHQFTYSLSWIVSNIHGGIPSQTYLKPKLWKTLKTEDFPTVKNSHNKDEMVKKIIINLVEYGFSLVTDVEPTLEKTREVFESIAPIQKGYFWGEVFTIQPQEEFNNNAFTNDFLAPHTDGSSLMEAPGVQVIHILKKSSEGGESTLSDAFYIANQFQMKDPESYNYITKTPIESNYKIESMKCNYKNCDTVFRLHPNTEENLQIRLNPYDIIPIKTIPQKEIRKWYKSFGAFIAELYDPANGIQFMLQPGTMLVFDNWRLLHGRKSFRGYRQLCGGFISHTEFKSRARLLGLIE